MPASRPPKHFVQFCPGEPEHGRPAMGAGKRVLRCPELVDDPLALLVRADRAGLYCTPAANDTGDPFAVAYGPVQVAVQEIAHKVVDLLRPLNLSHHGRDGPDQKRTAPKLLDTNSFLREHGGELAEDRCVLSRPVDDR